MIYRTCERCGELRRDQELHTVRTNSTPLYRCIINCTTTDKKLVPIPDTPLPLK